jgi:hypothetical protein
MGSASASSAIDLRLIRILTAMALQILEKGLEQPPTESLSRVSPEHQGTQETSRDSSRAKPKGDGCEEAGPARRSP